jgi:L,D-transpeptidase catalytic domain
LTGVAVLGTALLVSASAQADVLVRLERHWYSRQYEMTPMPWSMFFFRGYAVHGTMEAHNLGRAASHGCVRLRPDHAATPFSLMHKQKLAATMIVVTDKPLPPVAGAPLAEAETARPVPVATALVANAALANNGVEVSRVDVKAIAHVSASEPRQLVAARGEDAAVQRGRQAWLRGLAHKYDFREW